MPRKTDNMVRVHVWLDQDVVNKINQNYSESIGFSKAIRTILRQYIRKIDDMAAARAQPVNLTEVDLADQTN